MVVSRSYIAAITLLVLATDAAAVANPANILKTFFTGNGFVATNMALGTYSRSVIINNACKQMRQEGISEINEDLQMAIVTLTLLDIGGGALVPIANKIVDKIATDDTFKATRLAFATETDKSVPKALEFIQHHSDEMYQKSVKQYLDSRKAKIKLQFGKDLSKIGEADKPFLKHMKKLKKVLKVKTFLKALGPIFDLVNIGMSSYSLGKTVAACVSDPSTCNAGGIASASLSIASGIVGIIGFAFAGSAFAGPAAPIVAIVLALTATLIEIFYVPPLGYEAEKYRAHAQKLFEMDAFSRMQLETADKFLKESGMDNTDVYVVNQGHLPDWFQTTSQPESQLSGPLTFGLDYSRKYNNRGRKKETMYIKGKCDDFPKRGPTALVAKDGEWMCEYFEEGKGDYVVNSKMSEWNDYHVGPDFYGLAQNAHHEIDSRDPDYSNVMPDPEYRGVMVLVNTNKATNYWLVKAEGDKGSTTARLRGLDIDTESKLRIHDRRRTTFDDVVAIGDMRNMRSGSKVKIRTRAGRDVLNLDGWVKNLDADLGSNHNTLSFRGMSAGKQKERLPYAPNDYDEDRGFPFPNRFFMYYLDQKKGIKYNPGTGRLFLKTYHDSNINMLGPSSSSRVTERQMGFVHGVGIVAASPLEDEITLFAVQKDITNPDDHLTIFKFEGKGTYVFDADFYKSDEFRSDVPHFKIIDSAKYDNCRDNPLLKIKNMHKDSWAKHIVFKNDKIHIYFPSSGSKRLAATISYHTRCPGMVEARAHGNNTVYPRQLLHFIDTMDYTGNRVVHDFRYDAEGSSSADDVLYVHCPKKTVYSRKDVRNIETVVVRDSFFTDCDIDEDAELTVTSSEWTFPYSSTKLQGNGRIQGFANVKKIVNEFGAVIVDFTASQWSGSLYDEYTKKTGADMIDQSRLQPVVKNNLKMCITRVANLEKIKRGEIVTKMEIESAGTDATDAELSDECEQ